MVIFWTRKRGFIRGSGPTSESGRVKAPKHTNALVWYLLKPVFVWCVYDGVGGFLKSGHLTWSWQVILYNDLWNVAPILSLSFSRSPYLQDRIHLFFSQ